VAIAVLLFGQASSESAPGTLQLRTYASRA
jgi:hypothetical protein